MTAETGQHRKDRTELERSMLAWIQRHPDDDPSGAAEQVCRIMGMELNEATQNAAIKRAGEVYRMEGPEFEEEITHEHA